MRNSSKYKIICAQRGFTLVEIAIVLLIVGSMISISISAFLSYEERTKVRVTKQRLAVIQESMTKFLEINGRYPCVAPFTMRPEDAGFGLEGDSDPSGTNHSCQTGGGTVAIPGTINAPSANPILAGDNIRIGVLPVRTLNLPDEFAVDAWGGAFTYAVVKLLASENFVGTLNPTFSHAGGTIRIIDDVGDSVISPINSAHYIVLSHGRDQFGARVIESNNAADVKNPCNVATDPTPLQRDNCDDNAIFRLSPAFDDLAVFGVQRRRDNILPIGTVLAFDSSDCPEGWEEYFKATNRGRFLMGVDDNATPRDEISPTPTVRQVFDATAPPPGMVPATENRGNSTGEYQLGDIGEDGVENIPPYISLRYCMKQ